MRLMRGLNVHTLAQKFPESVQNKVQNILQGLEKKSWVTYDNGHWSLTRDGLVLSNKVFQELTFLADDI